MTAFRLRLPEDLKRRLGEEAHHCGQPRSQLIREAQEELLRRREQERRAARLTAAAEALASEPSARAASLDLAADFLPADCEARALAEDATSQGRTGQPSPQPWWRGCVGARSGGGAGDRPRLRDPGHG